VTDPLHQFGRSAGGQLGKDPVALVAVAHSRPNFNELVILQRPIELRDDVVREPFSARSVRSVPGRGRGGEGICVAVR